MNKKQLWEKMLSERKTNTAKSTTFKNVIKEAYFTLGSATTLDGKQVTAYGSTRHSRNYNYEDVKFKFGNVTGEGTYRWMNRPWQRFDFAEALKNAMIDAGVDKEFARECIDKSGSLRSAVEYFAKNYKSNKSLKEDKQLNEMLIDLILDRKDGFEYDPEEFYRDAMAYNSIFKGIADEITRAMDSGTEEDVKKALCNYVKSNGYDERICDYIKSVNWLDECLKEETSTSVRVLKKKEVDKEKQLKESDMMNESHEEEIEEVGSFEFCVMDKYGNNIDCFQVEEDAIRFAEKNSKADRVLLVKYGPEDEHKDKQELSAETIWTANDNEDDDKVYLIKYWLTEEDREEGFSDIFIDSFDSKQEAIMTAKKMVDRGDVASVEVFDAEDVTEQPVYFYDGNEESLKEARGAGKGQKLDKFFRLVGNLHKDNLSKEEIAKLEKAKAEVKRFEPTSEYEKKDKRNLLQQIEMVLKHGTLKEAIDLDRHVWEGWTVQDFIAELEPLFDRIMSGNSWKKPFKDKAELRAWCIDNQPYYKRYIPEVVEYFFKKMSRNESKESMTFKKLPRKTRERTKLKSNKLAKVNEELKIISSFDEYSPWSGAIDTWEKIEEHDKINELESILEDVYPDGLTMTELNDILWHESDWVLSLLGIVDEEI